MGWLPGGLGGKVAVSGCGHVTGCDTDASSVCNVSVPHLF